MRFACDPRAIRLRSERDPRSFWAIRAQTASILRGFRGDPSETTYPFFNIRIKDSLAKQRARDRRRHISHVLFLEF